MRINNALFALLAAALAACGGTDDSASESAAASTSTAAAPVTEPAAEPAPEPIVEPERAPAIDLAAMDAATRPQDNFFEYVNGTWLAETEIPADKGRYGSFLILRDQSREAVREIIEDAAANENATVGSEEQKIRDLYRSFMDVERINALGAAPLHDELSRIAAIENKQQLADYMAHAMRASISTPFIMWVNQDSKNPTEYIIYMHHGGLGMPDRDYYFDESERGTMLRDAYVAYLTRLGELTGMADAAERAQRIMALETQIAENHWTRVENRDRDRTYNKLSRAEIHALAPDFAWTVFLDGMGLANQEHYIVRQPPYLEGLGQLIADVDLATWKEYMTARVISDAAPMLSDDYFQANFDFYSKTLRGVEAPEDRWKRGVDLVNGTIGEIVGKQYVERHFPPAAKDRMLELVDNLKVAMAQSIDNLEWMTDATKVEAHAKLANFTTKIGYPDEWRDYSSLEISADDLIGNLERAAAFEFERNMAKLGGPIDRNEWFMNPQTVNAYYNPSMNEIVFPAAILQPPFFNMDADDAVNYGGIGAVIGHEIGHGFDDQGRKSDGNGVLRDWWTEADAAEYKARTDKLVAQYEGYYPVEDEHINGQLTLGENIGDLGGLTLAWRAYQHSLNGQEPERIDGFTGAQRFFLSFAQIWRNKSRDDTIRQRLKTDSHSPPRYRVLGVLPNFDPFYAAFDVKEGDEMYLPPEERVSIW